VCQPPKQIAPTDGHMIASPMECGRGGFIAFTQANPDPTKLQWFPKVYSTQTDDGTDEIAQWVEDQRKKQQRLAPQVR
jgi:hypothetical protein